MATSNIARIGLISALWVIAGLIVVLCGQLQFSGSGSGASRLAPARLSKGASAAGYSNPRESAAVAMNVRSRFRKPIEAAPADPRTVLFPSSMGLAFGTIGALAMSVTAGFVVSIATGTPFVAPPSALSNSFMDANSANVLIMPTTKAKASAQDLVRVQDLDAAASNTSWMSGLFNNTNPVPAAVDANSLEVETQAPVEVSQSGWFQDIFGPAAQAPAPLTSTMDAPVQASTGAGFMGSFQNRVNELRVEADGDVDGSADIVANQQAVAQFSADGGIPYGPVAVASAGVALALREATRKKDATATDEVLEAVPVSGWEVPMQAFMNMAQGTQGSSTEPDQRSASKRPMANPMAVESLVIGGTYESKDSEGQWWEIKIATQNEDGSYDAALLDNPAAAWNGVWAANCRPINKINKSARSLYVGSRYESKDVNGVWRQIEIEQLNKNGSYSASVIGGNSVWDQVWPVNCRLISDEATRSAASMMSMDPDIDWKNAQVDFPMQLQMNLPRSPTSKVESVALPATAATVGATATTV